MALPAAINPTSATAILKTSNVLFKFIISSFWFINTSLFRLVPASHFDMDEKQETDHRDHYNGNILALLIITKMPYSVKWRRLFRMCKVFQTQTGNLMRVDIVNQLRKPLSRICKSFRRFQPKYDGLADSANEYAGKYQKNYFFRERREFPGAWYHVMNRSRRRERVYGCDADYLGFVVLLQEAAHLWNAKIGAFCLMTNRYHLLIHTPLGNLSRCMRHINGVYTQRYNKAHGLDGQLFRGRFKAIVVDGDSYLLQLVRYTHINPVRAGIADRPDLYRW
jgi:REP element-mobilizing transposase RayT